MRGNAGYTTEICSLLSPSYDVKNSFRESYVFLLFSDRAEKGFYNKQRSHRVPGK